MSFGPFKCADCGVWWAGVEHRCGMKVWPTITTQPQTFGPAVTECPACHTWHTPSSFCSPVPRVWF